MKLSELSPVLGSTQVGKRKGRGAGSGNGKTGFFFQAQFLKMTAHQSGCPVFAVGQFRHPEQLLTGLYDLFLMSIQITAYILFQFFFIHYHLPSAGFLFCLALSKELPDPCKSLTQFPALHGKGDTDEILIGVPAVSTAMDQSYLFGF